MKYIGKIFRFIGWLVYFSSAYWMLKGDYPRATFDLVLGMCVLFTWGGLPVRK